MSDTMVPARELTLDLESPAAGGTSIARHDGQVVFVSGALPGERVRAVTEAGPAGRFLRAEAVDVLEASAHRVPDRRAAYATDVSANDRSGGTGFGGMEFAHVDLAHSRELKAEVLADQLTRIGHIDRSVEVRPAPGETDGTDWRTRVQLAVDSDGRVGMLAPRSHDVVPVATPPLAAGALHDLDLASLRLPGVRRLEFAWAGDHGALIVRGTPTDESIETLENWLPESFSLLTEAVGCESGNDRGSGDRTSGRSVRTHRGRGARGKGRGHAAPGPAELRVIRGSRTLTETVADHDFTVGADGFWQVHRSAAELLSSAVISALPDRVESITDLYCGVGLLGIGAARATGAPLFGVEGVDTAIEHARANAGELDARFLARSVDRTRLPDSDVIILDPPRAGAGKAVTSALIGSQARTLIYVSCDPATLARDLDLLTAGGFEIESLTGHDLFPLTAHLESVTVLRR
ncbi:class I SAM-dependent RNA methyltransferase [Brevibacterium atlanticum]|uniref:class I SAM-dependent RNA methyltransferase n=1 Tax=Brevibacterium atlanticum TaxID=2697563 RepID=UPI001D192A43|nr:TRAM domain-containing protein [Brevibacterium atlanticum]